jgi:hypothetical protein
MPFCRLPPPGLPRPIPGKATIKWLGSGLLALLTAWLLVLATAGGDDAVAPYQPFTPQEAALRCATEAGMTANVPGQRIPAPQMERLSVCMEREFARAAQP